MLWREFADFSDSDVARLYTAFQMRVAAFGLILLVVCVPLFASLPVDTSCCPAGMDGASCPMKGNSCGDGELSCCRPDNDTASPEPLVAVLPPPSPVLSAALECPGHFDVPAVPLCYDAPPASPPPRG